jgi:3D (Asp-Asp-Asp) domain-containing protein
MFAVLLRTLCGVLVLVGLTGGHRSRPQAEPDLLLPHGATRVPGAGSMTSAADGEQLEYQETTFYRVCRITAYCDRGLTAAGVRSGVGQCAAPADIPFGARVYIPALDRTFIVTDRTARRFRHNTVDLFIPDRGECLKFGCRYRECEITIPTQMVRYGSPRLHAAVAAFRS